MGLDLSRGLTAMDGASSFASGTIANGLVIDIKDAMSSPEIGGRSGAVDKILKPEVSLEGGAASISLCCATRCALAATDTAEI